MGEREHYYSHCSDAGNNMRHPGHAVDNGTILAIDTSTERLGVALLHGTRCIERQLQLGTGHANQVLALVAEVLAEAAATAAPPPSSASEATEATILPRGDSDFTAFTSACLGLCFISYPSVWSHLGCPRTPPRARGHPGHTEHGTHEGIGGFTRAFPDPPRIGD